MVTSIDPARYRRKSLSLLHLETDFSPDHPGIFAINERDILATGERPKEIPGTLTNKAGLTAPLRR
jgi:hypothetical protein